MPYLRVSVATWKIDLREPEGQAIIQQSRDELIPLLHRQPGFVRYQGAVTGPWSSVQVYEWESEAQSEAGTQQITEWLQRNGLGQQVDSLDVHRGEVIVSS